MDDDGHPGAAEELGWKAVQGLGDPDNQDIGQAPYCCSISLAFLMLAWLFFVLPCRTGAEHPQLA